MLVALLALLASLPASPWREVAPGVVAASAADLGGDSGWAARVVLVDPERTTLSVRFDGARPSLAQWRARAPEALVVANGSFYSDDGPAGAEIRPTCDVVLRGRPVRGAGCLRRDALWFGAEAAPSSTPPALSSHAARPRVLGLDAFRAADWTFALKSFPPLVRDGKAACASGRYCGETSRTAALGILRDGRVFFFASQWPAVRREVARFLAEALGAADAINLDGGPEATLSLRGEAEGDSIGTPGRGLPLVILVAPRTPEALPPERRR